MALHSQGALQPPQNAPVHDILQLLTTDMYVRSALEATFSAVSHTNKIILLLCSLLPGKTPGGLKIMYIHFVYKLIYKAPKVVTSEAPFSQRWPKPSPVLIAPTHGGMARLSGPEWPG